MAGCHALLGIPDTALTDEIEEAYRRKKLEFASDVRKLQELEGAYNEATAAAFAPVRAFASPLPPLTIGKKKPQTLHQRSGMGRSLALFDFDGTLTVRDTFMDFHRFVWGNRRLLACAYAAAKGCLFLNLGRDFLKEAFLTALWKGVPREEYVKEAHRYAENRVENLLAPLALSVFQRHVERGHDVYVVTASMKEWIEPWASKYGVPVIGTELEDADGILTGRMNGANCRGIEKERRITQIIDLKNYGKVYAYGNSSGDREMLLLADEKVYNWDHVPEFGA